MTASHDGTCAVPGPGCRGVLVNGTGADGPSDIVAREGVTE